MQNSIKYIIITFICFGVSQEPPFKTNNLVGSNWPTTYPLESIIKSDSNKLKLNHGFSFITNTGPLGSNNMGIYHNQMSYKFSDKLKINSNLNFINSNKSIYNNTEKINIQYKLGLEYKLSENSHIYFNFSNSGNSNSSNHRILNTSLYPW